jgi:hypothetical protein
MMLGAVLLCALPQSVDLAFAPKPGSYVVRKLSTEHALSLRELSTVRAGVVQSSTEPVDVKSTQSLHCTDQYQRVGSGRPLLLERRFDSLEWKGAIRVGAMEESVTARSPLSGLSVMYTYVPEEQGYGRYFSAREGIEETLHGLSEDLDLRALLPDHPQTLGASWSVPPASMVDVFAPAGRWGLSFQSKPQQRNLVRSIQSGIGCNLVEVFGEECKGSVGLKLVSADEREARIEIKVELANRVDRRALVQMQMNGAELSSGYRCPSAPLNWSFQGAGTLVYDREARRVSELTLEGRQTVRLETELLIGNDPVSTTQRLALEGTLKLRWLIGDPRDPRLKAAPAEPKPTQGQK